MVTSKSSTPLASRGQGVLLAAMTPRLLPVLHIIQQRAPKSMQIQIQTRLKLREIASRTEDGTQLKAMKALIKTANERAPRLKGPQPSAEDRKLRAAARPPHARLIAATWPLLLAPHRLSAAVSQTTVQ
ncbi:unnamed protein product [Arctogadus glacialis]